MRKVKKHITDLDEKRFIQSSFEKIKQHFQKSLKLYSQSKSFEYDFSLINNFKFTSEIFIKGQSIAKCKIWISNALFKEGSILYVENNFQVDQDNGFDHYIGMSDNSSELLLSAFFNDSIEPDKIFDLKHLTPDDAANYLWCCFTNSFDEIADR